MKTLFISLLTRLWEIFILKFLKSFKRDFFCISNNKKAIFLKQKIILDIGENGKVNKIEVKNTIQNVSRRFISKYNHLLRCDLPSLEKVGILAFDNQGSLPKPEIIEKNPQFIDFYVLFRKSLKFKEKYTYSWICSNIEKFFDFSYTPLTWIWTPIAKVLEARFEIYHPAGFKLANALAVIKNTGEEIEVAQTKMVGYNREATEIILKNCSQGSYEIRWRYEEKAV